MHSETPVTDLPCAYCHEETVYADKYGQQWCASCNEYNGVSVVVVLTQESLFEPRWPGDWYGRQER
jgi:hypothetical protein